ncbi:MULTISPECIES: restriction endonuclease subunit S [Vibrio]|uniref:restriction endonuclease subunit S n=1 Tax=Vibrio TaxID=662 RepID=UPI002FD02C23
MSVDKNVPEIRFKGFSGEWEHFSIECCSSLITKGTTPMTIGRSFVDSGISFVKVESVDEIGNINQSKFAYIDVETDQILARSRINENDLLISIAGALGRAAIVKKEILPANTNQALAIVRLKNDSLVTVEFLYHFTKTKDFRDFVDASASQGAQPNLSLGDISNVRILAPKKEEQEQIGNYFQKLDTLINQHQQKHDKLSHLKKAMLEKMFPKQGETVPEIRFKGFGGEWEEKPFGTCFANVPNNTLSRAELNYRTGLAKNIHYGDILIKFGETLDADSELIPFITNNDVANKLKHTALQSGDIVIADAAEDNTVGKCVELINVGDLLVFSGLHTIAVRPTQPFGSKYLGYYLNSGSYHDQLSSLMQGTKVLSISKTAIQNTLVVFPNNVEEQAAIGNYFQKLDALINQHQQQITKLNNIKQACLSKMFV